MSPPLAPASLAGHVALVTGSTSGIGEAVARQFAAAGASVLVNSVHSVAAGAALAADLPDALYVQGSIADGEDVTHLVDAALERWGRIDTLVNNAATTVVIPHADLATADLDVWREIFSVNVFGTWAMTVAAVPALRDTGGSVVNIGSIAALRPTGSSVPYAASKAALHQMTVLLAKALGPQVRLNVVAPGMTDTPWTAEWHQIRERVRASSPLQRAGQPDDVAEMVLALATASYVTGQVVVVDGGQTLV
jgi:ketoreductase RED2